MDTWDRLFERADASDATLDEVRRALAERREGRDGRDRRDGRDPGGRHERE
ncbi:hypothetical protein ACFQPA_14285 [Halomarina halobia]|uniref:Uncharacterized protein n=1 Tax=Halomarina halobia TaxID=3033386 RepID=A0ABD6A835_9EURY|nr:hypothetical protein [Halomarina sp. PSR21]